MFIISAGIGGYLYSINNEKVNAEYILERSKVIPINSCGSFTPIINLSSPDQIKEVLSLNNNLISKTLKVNLLISDNYVVAKISGKPKDLKELKLFADSFYNKLKDFDSIKFNQIYSKNKVYCNGLVLQAFDAVYFSDVILKSEKNRYGRLHLFILSISPLLVLSLLLIAYGYLKNKSTLKEQ
jgi:hypothetical protein